MSTSAIEQGTPEWHALRVGKVTASRVADVARKLKSGGISKDRDRYMGELIAERMTGVPSKRFVNADMDWGTLNESAARMAYSMFADADVEQVAFVVHPILEQSGASPDGLVGDAGLVEIKCPATHTHIATLLGAPIDPDYATQMLWQMACTCRRWCDFVSFDPRMPPDMQLHVVRFERDDVRIAQLETEVRKFLAELDETEAALLRRYREAA